MKYDVVGNARRGVLTGTAWKLVNIVLSFLNRTLLLYVLGSEYLGLNSLLSTVLNILNLAELGFGTSVVYAMYRPIAENDTVKLRALLAYYKKVYRTVGVIVLAAGLCMMPFLDKLIEGDIPEGMNLHLIFLIQLANTAVGYFFFAYKSAVLSAYQRHDISNAVSMLTSILSYAAQLSLLVITKNYYLYIGVLPFITVLGTCLNAAAVSKYYPECVAEGELDKQEREKIKTKVKALFIGKVGGVIANYLDNIVIAGFMGLTAVANYNNYYLIYSNVANIVVMFHTTLKAGIGNRIVLESKEQNYQTFLKLNFMNDWIVGACAICMMCLYQPFMRLWVGEEYMYPISTVVLLVVYFYINITRHTVVTYKDAAGLWEAETLKPLVSGALNVTLNIVLIQRIGVNGVILSTLLSFVAIEIPWEIEILFRNYFKMSSLRYYGRQILIALYFGLLCAGTYFLCSFLPFSGIAELLAKGVVCAVVPNCITALLFRDDFHFLMKCIRK